MKKFFKIFFLLIVLGILGTILFFGFYRIEDGKGAIFSSVSEGLLNKAVLNGYHWEFRKIVPKNIKIITFPTRPQYVELNIKRPLPGIYFLNNQKDFSISFHISIRYIIPKDMAVKIYKYFDYDFKNISKYIKRKGRIAISDRLTEIVTGNLFSAKDKVRSLDIFVLDSLKKEFEETGLEINSTELYDIYVPDIYEYKELLKNNKLLTEEYQKKRLTVFQAETEKDLEKIRLENKLKYLERVGNIIKDNKAILNYLFIDKLSEQTKFIIVPDSSLGIMDYLKLNDELNK